MPLCCLRKLRERAGAKLNEAELGPTHPHTLSSVNNLAILLRAQGKYAEAEPLFRRALQGREAELGPTYPHTLSSVNNLANLLSDQGKEPSRSSGSTVRQSRGQSWAQRTRTRWI